MKNNLISWANFILSDYISASLISPIHNLLLSTWKNGYYLLCILHYHIPFDLNLDIFQHENSVLDLFIQMYNESFHTTPAFLLPSSNIPDNDLFITQFLLLEFIPFLKIPATHQHLEKIKSLSSNDTPTKNPAPSQDNASYLLKNSTTDDGNYII